MCEKKTPSIISYTKFKSQLLPNMKIIAVWDFHEAVQLPFHKSHKAFSVVQSLLRVGKQAMTFTLQQFATDYDLNQ